MSKITVATILPDTVTEIAFNHLFQKFFGINPTNLKKWDCNAADSFEIYVISSDLFVNCADFFIPRRNKTLVLNSDNMESTGCNSLNRYADEECIIERIKGFVTKAKERNNTPHNDLSGREIEVLSLIAEGCLNKEIADKLNISINTVLTHRKNITSKLGIRSVSGLSFYAMMNGYVNNI